MVVVVIVIVVVTVVVIVVVVFIVIVVVTLVPLGLFDSINYVQPISISLWAPAFVWTLVLTLTMCH